jgi:hypothetical protein
VADAEAAAAVPPDPTQAARAAAEIAAADCVGSGEMLSSSRDSRDSRDKRRDGRQRDMSDRSSWKSARLGRLPSRPLVHVTCEVTEWLREEAIPPQNAPIRGAVFQMPNGAWKWAGAVRPAFAYGEPSFFQQACP